MGILSDGLEVIKLANIAANAELHEKLAKYVEHAQELNAKVETLEEANRLLKEQLRFKGVVKRIGSHVFEDGDEYPICSRCADVDHRAVHLMFQQDRSGVCPQCKSSQRRFIRRSEVERMAREGASI